MIKFHGFLKTQNCKTGRAFGGNRTRNLWIIAGTFYSRTHKNMSLTGLLSKSVNFPAFRRMIIQEWLSGDSIRTNVSQNETAQAVTANGSRYREIITNLLWAKLVNMWFQPSCATWHTTNDRRAFTLSHMLAISIGHQCVIYTSCFEMIWKKRWTAISQQ